MEQPSADRIEQMRAIRLVGILLAVLALAGVGFFVRGLFHGSPEQNQVAVTPVASHPPSSSSSAPSAPTPEATPEPESKESHPAPVGPPLSEEDIKTLKQQRAYSVEFLRTVEGILNARSFAAKAEIYCRFSTAQTESLTTGGVSGDQIEQRYRELLRTEPTTQEGELQRRQQLSTLEQLVITHRQNLSQCQGAAAMGMEKIPPDEELRIKADQSRRMIIEIDKALASGYLPVVQAPPSTATADAPSSPLQPGEPLAAPSTPQTPGR